MKKLNKMVLLIIISIQLNASNLGNFLLMSQAKGYCNSKYISALGSNTIPKGFSELKWKKKCIDTYLSESIVLEEPDIKYYKAGHKAMKLGNRLKARELWEKSCNNGNAKSCYNSANLYYDGIKGNEEKAIELLSKGCDLKL